MSDSAKKWVAMGSMVVFAILGVVLKEDVKSVVCGDAPAIEAPAE